MEAASQAAISLEAKGDQAAAEGEPSAAASDYGAALGTDRSNTAAASGLQAVDQKSPDGIRDARDWWSQFVSNTLVPIGQFLLWALAALVVLYILRLLARIVVQGPWLSVLPSPGEHAKTAGSVSFALAAAAAVGTACLGTLARPSSGWWLAVLAAVAAVAAALVVLGFALLAWDLQSGTGLQVSVTDNGGGADTAACAYLVGRLNELGITPPRGFDLPQSTDVTTLNGALAVLPGGGTLSALIDFLLGRVPATPWEADVTLIDADQLLVTLHHNRQLVLTQLANRNSLLFPVPDAGQDADGPSPDATDIDQNGLLTIAAAVILTGMSADPRSSIKQGLNGASRWESVAGQVLATDQESAGKESFRKALLARAVDIDEGNLAARVAQTVLDGRWAKDPGERDVFAKQITEIGNSENLHYPALELRVYYSAAAGWYNVYLDRRNDRGRKADGAKSGQADALTNAFYWTGRLVTLITELTKAPGWEKDPPGKLAGDMRPVANALGDALNSIPAAARKTRKIPVNPEWEAKPPLTSRELYAQACRKAAKYDDGPALDDLEKAIEIDGDLRLWARYDPSFTRLAADDVHHARFVNAVNDPAIASFTSVGPLASYADKLADIGVHTAQDLEGKAPADAEQLAVAQAVDVDQLVVARWLAIAALYNLQPKPNDTQVDALVAHNADSLAAILALRQDDASRKTIATDTLNTHGQITAEQLEAWARSADGLVAANKTGTHPVNHRPAGPAERANAESAG